MPEIETNCAQKKPPRKERPFDNNLQKHLALARFELALRLVDHINAAFASYDAAITVPVLQRAERVTNFHIASPILAHDRRLGCS